MNKAAKVLVARMARREAAARRRGIEGSLDRVEGAMSEAFESACNSDQEMATLRRSESARSYFETVFFNQFDSNGDYR